MVLLNECSMEETEKLWSYDCTGGFMQWINIRLHIDALEREEHVNSWLELVYLNWLQPCPGHTPQGFASDLQVMTRKTCSFMNYASQPQMKDQRKWQMAFCVIPVLWWSNLGLNENSSFTNRTDGWKFSSVLWDSHLILVCDESVGLLFKKVQSMSVMFMVHWWTGSLHLYMLPICH